MLEPVKSYSETNDDAMNEELKEILKRLPYADPFRFVDELGAISETGAAGRYTFRPESWFYPGHFPGNPVTPGVILTECCAQIGLVCLGIFLLGASVDTEPTSSSAFALTDSQMDFLLPVYPGETVRVVSEKQYFRFGKLRCDVRMYKADGQLACKGRLSGMIQNSAE